MSSIQLSNFSKKFRSLTLTELKFSGRELGRGSDAVVMEVDYQGTFCAAKKLHDILLGDQSCGGAQRLVQNFESEIITWHTLRHPHIVLLLGVYFEHGSRVPTLILEKMQSSLRRYIEKYKKEEVPLPDKVFILHQVSQALAYLHSRQPSLVHHDLSPNNILLNQDSLLTKITDFGMSRAVDLSHSTRKSSVKGTRDFMPPEALVRPPKYTEKLDIFSFGNITLFTLTHLWPEPLGPPVVFPGDKPVAVLEFQRREQYTKILTVEERFSLFDLIRSCLDNRPHRRPTSLQLEQQMRQIEKTHPRAAHTRESNAIAQLTQQLKEMYDQLKIKDDQLKQKNNHLEQIVQDYQRQQQEIERLQRDNQRLQQERNVFQRQVNSVQSTAPTARRSSPFPVKPLPPPKPKPKPRHKTPALPRSSSKSVSRNWRELKHQKTNLECHAYCCSVAVQGDVVYVGIDQAVLLFSRKSGVQVSKLGSGQIESFVFGVAFIDDDTIVVSADDGRLRTYTTKGQLIHTFGSGKDGFRPRGLTVGTNGHIFVCDEDNHCIRVFNVDGKFLHSFGSEGSGVGQFNWPWDVCMDGEGLLFISDMGNSRICVYSVEGAFIRKFPTPRQPTCVAVTHCNHLVVSSNNSDTVMIMTTSGQLVHEFGGEGGGPGQFSYPRGVAVDNENCVYICDECNGRVQVY